MMAALIIIAFLLFLLSSFVSYAESAFFSITDADHQLLAQKEKPIDAHIVALLEDQERLSATLLIANVILKIGFIFLLYAAVGSFFVKSDALLALFLIAIMGTLLLLFAEIVAKVYASQHRFRAMRQITPLVRVLQVSLYPLSSLWINAIRWINTRFGTKSHNLSVDELSQALELTEDQNSIQTEEKSLLRGIIQFGEVTVKSIMTSRLEMVSLDLKSSYQEVLTCIVENTYSRIPIYDSAQDSMDGILYIKDLLPHIHAVDFNWQALIRPAYFVPETKKIDDLLADFQVNKIHIAIVVSEFGGVTGLVTLEDIIEEILGEIQDEYDNEQESYIKESDSVYLFEGKELLSDFFRITQINESLFSSQVGEADSLAGLILQLKGGFPDLNEVITFLNFSFEVIERDERRIIKLKLTIH